MPCDLSIMARWPDLAPLATVWNSNGPSPWRALLSFLAIVYASVFVHELGHALMGRVAGFLVTSFGSGTSRPVCVVRIKGIRIYACLIRPFQGLTWAFQTPLHPSKRQTIAFAAGGILANSLTALISLTIWWFWPAAPFELGLMTYINGAFALMNLIPYQARIGTATAQTDGMLILKALRSQTTATQAPTTIQIARFFRGLFNATGDTIMSRVFLLMAADAWSDLEDPEMADAALAEAAETADSERPEIHAFDATIRAKVALGAGRLDEAASALDVAESYYATEPHEAGLFRVAALRTSLAVAHKDIEGAHAAFASWESHPLTERVPALRLSTIVLGLSHAIERSDASAVAKLMAEYEASRPFGPSAARDLRIYSAVARFSAGLGDTEAAESAYRQALVAVKELAAAWSDKADRTRFLERRSALLTEARDFLETIGNGEEADKLIGRLEGTPGAASTAPNPRLVRLGLWIMGLNVVSVAGMTVAALLLGPGPGVPSLISASLISFCTISASLISYFTIFAGLYVAFHLVLGRRLSLPRLGQGRMIVYLSCFPWFIVIGMVVTHFLTPGLFRP
jgi:hypothetical protein